MTHRADISYKELKLYRSGIAAIDSALPDAKHELGCGEFGSIRVLAYSEDGDACTSLKITPCYWSNEADAYIPAKNQETTVLTNQSSGAVDISIANAESVFLMVSTLTLGSANAITLEVQGISTRILP